MSENKSGIGLYRKYESATLKKLQRIETEILKDFDDFCMNNNIEYFACGGTAIGVVRHGGFIPWDDDIDVGLLRDDYDRFLNVAREQLSDKYYLLNTDTDSNYPLMSTRLVLNGTKFREECFKDLSGNFGIFLDIYCFDYIPDEEAVMRRKAKSLWLKSKLMILTSIGRPVLYFGGAKAKIVTAGCICLNKVFRVLRIKPSAFYKSICREISKDCTPSNRVAYQFDPNPFTSIIDVGDIIPTKRMQFEDIQISVPAKVENYLKKRYGDYMTLPPEEKRHNHPPYELDFGKY